MQLAVEMRDKAGKKGGVALEASGGVTLETIRFLAETGVDFISVGRITQSAPAVDIGLDYALSR
jgi:nicotinate-nucleotide pyrophosphorylase (carboxylating)